jgi:serine/threonine protein phosphatase 1
MPARRDGLWIAIGHTVVASPVIQHRRIMLDTGAYRSGVLSAARIADGTIGVIST